MTALFLCLVFVVLAEGFSVDKKAGDFASLDDFPDYQLGVKYDEYPLIVPKKRTALLVNRLMVALKEAMKDDIRDESLRGIDSLDRLSSRSIQNSVSPEDLRSMDLQRRGHSHIAPQKGRNYWRCYFNAVTCF